ncbi:MAG: shikimate dehydrogenase family protein, partial [Anaerolineae bacterium]
MIGGHTRLVGVIGWPVAHSRSPAMHNAALSALGLDWCYVPLPVAPADLESALRGLVALGFVGANVTIPHKERAAELVDERTPAAAAIGAVNTITVAGGRLLGDNTDAPGLLLVLAEAGVEVAGKQVVVLGAGGSARAMAYALGQAGARVAVANRTP